MTFRDELKATTKSKRQLIAEAKERDQLSINEGRVEQIVESIKISCRNAALNGEHQIKNWKVAPYGCIMSFQYKDHAKKLADMIITRLLSCGLTHIGCKITKNYFNMYEIFFNIRW